VDSGYLCRVLADAAGSCWTLADMNLGAAVPVAVPVTVSVAVSVAMSIAVAVIVTVAASLVVDVSVAWS
jgi:hypothetical protein